MSDNPELNSPATKTNKMRTALCLGSLATTVAISAIYRYASTPDTDNFLMASGPHIAIGIFIGSCLNWIAEYLNGKARFSQKHTTVFAIGAGLVGLAANTAFEYYGHPLETFLDPDNGQYLQAGRELGKAYGDWILDTAMAGISSAIAYYTSGAAFGFGSSRKKIKKLTSTQQPQH